MGWFLIMTKMCKRCNIERDISEFTYRKDINKYRNVCNKCRYKKWKGNKSPEEREEIRKLQREWMKRKRVNPGVRECEAVNQKNR